MLGCLEIGVGSVSITEVVTRLLLLPIPFSLRVAHLGSSLPRPCEYTREQRGRKPVTAICGTHKYKSMGVAKIGIDSRRYYPKSATWAKAELGVYSAKFPSVEVGSTSYRASGGLS